MKGVFLFGSAPKPIGNISTYAIGRG